MLQIGYCITLLNLCFVNPPRPAQGSKPPKSGLSQKIPIFSTGHHRENVDFLTQTALFLGRGKWGVFLREAKPGGFQTRVFPTFFGKVQIVSRTLSGLFLVGALNRPRKRKRTNPENPRTIPEQVGKIPEKSGKDKKGQKRTKKEGQDQIGKPPPFETPPLSGP